MIRIKFKMLLLALGLVALTSVSWALKSDASQPVNIVANSWTGDQKNKVFVFSGDVVATRGSMIVHAATATVSEDSGGYKTIHLVGTPVTFSQLNDEGDRTDGQCNDFEYNTKNNLAILTGRARVKKGGNLVMGDKLTYNTQTQVYSAVAASGNGVSTRKSGRVTVILQPDSKKGNDGSSAVNFQ